MESANSSSSEATSSIPNAQSRAMNSTSESAMTYRAGNRAMRAISGSELDNMMIQRTDLRAIDAILGSDDMGATVRALAQLRMTGQQFLEYLNQPHVRKRIRNALLIALLAGLPTYGLIMCAGFGSAGVAGGSLAAGVQSVVYGASVPAGSLFASLQSMGALGTLSTSFAVPVALAVGGVAGVGIPVAQAAGAAAADTVRGWLRRD